MADPFSLKGRIALVAGASKEMGSAIATMLAEYGADVAVSARFTGRAAFRWHTPAPQRRMPRRSECMDKSTHW